MIGGIIKKKENTCFNSDKEVRIIIEEAIIKKEEKLKKRKKD